MDKLGVKIVIFGSYNGGSIGDTAILIGLLSAIRREYGADTDVTVMTLGYVGIQQELKEIGIDLSVKEVGVRNGQEGKKIIGWFNKFKCKLLQKPNIDKKLVRDLIRRSDHLLIGGGNLIMDIYPSWPPLLGMICDIANKEKVKYSFLGVGAAPIYLDNSRKILKKCLYGAFKVHFRDSFSKKYCEKILSYHSSHVGPDLAFGIDWQEKNDHNSQSKSPFFLVNVAALYSELWPIKNKYAFLSYVKGMVSLVDSFCEKNNVEKVFIFNTNYPLDDIGVKEFFRLSARKQSKYSIEYAEGKKSVNDLLKYCANADWALVTRLHAGIIASLAGCKKIFAIAYQPKVKDVLTISGITKSIIDLDTLESSSVDLLFELKSSDSKGKLDPHVVDVLVAEHIGYLTCTS